MRQYIKGRAKQDEMGIYVYITKPRDTVLMDGVHMVYRYNRFHTGTYSINPRAGAGLKGLAPLRETATGRGVRGPCERQIHWIPPMGSAGRSGRPPRQRRPRRSSSCTQHRTVVLCSKLLQQQPSLARPAESILNGEVH